MPDITPGLGEDDVLGDIGGVVPKTFQIPRDQNQIERRLDIVGMRFHMNSQVLKDLVFDFINTVIGRQDLPGHLDITANERIQGVLHHSPNEVGHDLQLRNDRQRTASQVVLARVSDIDRLIAHALKIRVDLDDGQNQSQIFRHRTLLRQKSEARVIHADLLFVDFFLDVVNETEPDLISLDETRRHFREGPLHMPTHDQNLSFEIVQLRVECSLHDRSLPFCRRGDRQSQRRGPDNRLDRPGQNEILTRGIRVATSLTKELENCKRPGAVTAFLTHMQPRLSAIDIGSNAIRLIIGEVRSRRLMTIKKFREPIRLGRDVFREGRISENTLREALEAFKKFTSVHGRFGVVACRAVATSAVREAANGAEFVERVLRQTGIQIEVIDGIEEAQLIHGAVQREVDLSRKRILLVDIGGGSVEVTFSESGMMSATQSFPMGTVRMLQMLKERHLAERGLRVIMGEFLAPLGHYLESHTGAQPVEWAVGTGGNLECMGRLKVQLLHRSPHTLVSLAELVEITRILEGLSVRERIENLKLRPDRADVIVPALVLVKTILRQAGIKKILIPGVGLRDGILWSLATSRPDLSL